MRPGPRIQLVGAAITLACAVQPARAQPVDVAIGAGHACAIVSGGQVLCWGDNAAGQLGDGTTTSRPNPASVAGLGTAALGIAAGAHHSCALLADFRVRCWGANAYGQLGVGDTAARHTPTDVVGLPPVSQVSAGGRRTCALASDGRVYCFGWAHGTFSACPGPCAEQVTQYSRPREVPGFTGIVEIASGVQEEGAISGNGTVLCGRDSQGEAYCTSRFDQPPGRFDERASDVASIATGGRHTCWLTRSNGARCAGNNQWGQGGTGRTATVMGPTPVSGLDADTTGIAAGATHTCSWTRSGRAQCWGAGGLLGDATVVSRVMPVEVSGLSGVTRIVTGPASSCAIASSGLWCWGSNASGELGDGSRALAHEPVGVAGIASGERARVPGVSSGMWWNPLESGWGMYVAQRGAVFFVAIYSYDSSGRPTWLVAPECRIPSTWPPNPLEDSTRCDGTLFEVRGPVFFGAAFDPAAARTAAVGALHISFAGRHDALVRFSAHGIERSAPMTRQVHRDAVPRPAIDHTDLWWQSTESGWGVAIAQQRDSMFVAWYVYDGNGRPTWYVAPDCRVASGADGCAGTLYFTTGPASGTPFDPSQVHASPAGSVELRFSGPNSATLAYTVGGVTGVKAITRQVF